MKEEIFITRKEKLKAFLEMLLKTPDSSEITTILEILNQYTFDNRLKLKGTLTRYIIDSSEVDYSIGEKVIEFDTNIR